MIGIGNRRPLGGRAQQIRRNIGQNRPANQPRPQQPRRPGTPIPFNLATQNAINEGRTQRDQTLAGLRVQGLATQQAYGLEGPFADAATNPYSRAAQLQKSYEQAQRGNLNSSAAAGQLYAGSFQNARQATRADLDQKMDSLWKDYNADRFETRQEGIEARQDFRTLKANAPFEAIADALKEDPEAMASPRRNQRQRNNRPNNRRRNQIRRNVNRGPIRNQGIR